MKMKLKIWKVNMKELYKAHKWINLKMMKMITKCKWCSLHQKIHSQLLLIIVIITSSHKPLGSEIKISSNNKWVINNSLKINNSFVYLFFIKIKIILEYSERQPLLYVDVNLGGNRMERIVVFPGDNTNLLAN